MERCPKRPQCCYRVAGIFGVGPYPHIKIFGRAYTAVCGQSVGSDNQEFNALGVQLC